MRTKNRQNIAKMYSDSGVIPLLQEMGVDLAKGEVRFLTGSSQVGVSANAQWKYAENSLIVLSNRHNLSPFIWNRGRCTRW